MSCYDCKYAVLEDYGYSNYTTEGTNFRCGVDKHPEEYAFDAFYGEAEKLKYGEICPFFVDGSPVLIDVEHEALETLTPEEKQIYEGTIVL